MFLSYLEFNMVSRAFFFQNCVGSLNPPEEFFFLQTFLQGLFSRTSFP